MGKRQLYAAKRHPPRTGGKPEEARLPRFFLSNRVLRRMQPPRMEVGSRSTGTCGTRAAGHLSLTEGLLQGSFVHPDGPDPFGNAPFDNGLPKSTRFCFLIR
jgi:hypothetical protein